MTKFSLRKINWECFNRLSGNQQYILLFFLFLLCGLLGCWLALRSDFCQYKRLLSEESRLKMEFAEKQKKANLIAYQEQYKALEKNYKEQLKMVSKKDEVYNLLNDISKAGAESGLVIELFSPRLIESQNFLTEMTVTMVMIGEYQQLALFLSRILQFNRLIKFCDFEIRKVANNEPKNSSKIGVDKLLRLSMRAKIYQYKNNKYHE